MAMSLRRVRMMNWSVVPRCSMVRSLILPIDSVTAQSWMRMPAMPV